MVKNAQNAVHDRLQLALRLCPDLLTDREGQVGAHAHLVVQVALDGLVHALAQVLKHLTTRGGDGGLATAYTAADGGGGC